jgi:hypothetical protein
VTLAAIGDSLTCGWMARKGYVDFLQEMLREKYPESRFSILASGVPGDTADFGLYRVETDVLHQAPDLSFSMVLYGFKVTLQPRCKILPGLKAFHNIQSAVNIDMPPVNDLFQ